LITLAIDQRSIDSGNELVKPIIKVKSDNTIYFPQLEYISFIWVRGIMLIEIRLLIYSENYIKEG